MASVYATRATFLYPNSPNSQTLFLYIYSLLQRRDGNSIDRMSQDRIAPKTKVLECRFGRRFGDSEWPIELGWRNILYVSIEKGPTSFQYCRGNLGGDFGSVQLYN